jgi:2,4-dienoyl-CoA reductase (NADPH2)
MADIRRELRITDDVSFRSRVIRSSIGGRNAYYDGTVNDSWVYFERRCAMSGIGAMISATIAIDHDRWSPLEYPQLGHEDFVKPLRKGIKRVKEGDHKDSPYIDCPYILQIGDPGSHTQTSLFREDADAKSASSGFDFLYGYTSWRQPLCEQEIRELVEKFAKSAGWAKEARCDGVELTISKGYVIQQFLNPATNRRKDEYGGPLKNRYKLVEQIARGVRKAVGPKYMFGIRISGSDSNKEPWTNFHWPPRYKGNELQDMIQVAKWLQDDPEIKIDFVHVTNGFGFPCPKGSPGRFPTRDAQIFVNATRHLSMKAAFRAQVFNLLMLVFRERLVDWAMNLDWKYGPAANLADAWEFKKQLEIPVIVNGGFQEKFDIEAALEICDAVSMARPLLANPDLLDLFRNNQSPRFPCTFCNRCAARTALFPLGCYDRSRYANQEQMEDQILAWVRDPDEPGNAIPERGLPRCLPSHTGAVVRNFGRNVCYKTERVFQPRTEQEVLWILEHHQGQTIRAKGPLHSWSRAADSTIMVDMSRLNSVEPRTFGENAYVRVGAGCSLNRLLKRLRKTDFTLKTIGSVTAQSVAGAIATGTHGSGRVSLSHTVAAVRVAAYDRNGRPSIFEFTQGDELRALRCSLGRAGIVLSVVLECRRRYEITETVAVSDSLDVVLEAEGDYPLQEFGLFPFTWQYTAYRRREVQGSPAQKRHLRGWLYVLIYRTLLIDFLYHLTLRAVLPLTRFRSLRLRSIRLFNRIMGIFLASLHLALRALGFGRVTDESSRALTRKHHLFRHVEMEVFVPRSQIRPAVALIREITSYFAGEINQLTYETNKQVVKVFPPIGEYCGSYAHHYPIWFRRVLPDDTLVSMTAHADEDHYSIGFFSYHPGTRESYYKYTECLARALRALHGARLHWGKHFPLGSPEIAPLYPRLQDFERICTQLDSSGTFRNEFTSRVLGF